MKVQLLASIKLQYASYIERTKNKQLLQHGSRHEGRRTTSQSLNEKLEHMLLSISGAGIKRPFTRTNWAQI
jgi:hypothetical protein